MTSEPEAPPSENVEEEFEDRGATEPTFSQSEPTTQFGDEYEEEQPAGEEEGEQFSRLGTSSEDPEQKRLYKEYLLLIKEIECQNQIINDIKMRQKDLCATPGMTEEEQNELQTLNACMKAENEKLCGLMEKAMKLQNFGSRRNYREIPIATTIDEDCTKPYAMTTCTTSWGVHKTFGEKVVESSEKASSSYSDSRSESNLRTLCNAMGKMKICCAEDRRLIQEIAMALLGAKKPCPRETPCPSQKHHHHSSVKQRRPCPHKSKGTPQSDVMICMPANIDAEGSNDSAMGKLKQKICCMQDSVNKLKAEIYRREQEKECQRLQQRPREQNWRQEQAPRREPCPSFDPCRDPCREPCRDPCSEQKMATPHKCNENLDALHECNALRNTKTEQMAKLKESYLYLLTEFAKKDCKLKEIEKRMKGFCGNSGGGGGGSKSAEMREATESEIQMLRARVNELKEEQVEFKCIMKEQSHQLEDYRNKYLMAQQKVEEQTVTLDKLNMNNKRIENQINLEVKEIRAKFQEKLNELLHFPKLLENEQLKLAQVCKEKEDLKGKLVLVCKEFKTLKAQLDAQGNGGDCRQELAKCSMELSKMKTKLEEVERQRDLFCEQLRTTQDDLDTLRSESAKIIARTKERAELIKLQQQEQIDRLEKELAQCRATACLSVSDREAVIREMQGQLNTLSFSFDAAQKQIKTLRNHVAYVSNENCFPVKC